MTIIQRLSRQLASARPASSRFLPRPSASSSFLQRRCLHAVPTLPNLSQLEANGVPNLLTPAGFDIAWTQYQGMMVDEITHMVAQTQYQDAAIKDIVLNTARNPAEARLFNHASMAFNNHFFFNGLSANESRPPMSQRMAEEIEKDFSSVTALKDEIFATALGMFGPGFVWLVRHKPQGDASQGRFRILATYLAGSPLPGAHYRQQTMDMNTQSYGSLKGLSPADYARQTVVQNGPGSFNKGKQNLAPGGAEITPVLCVNTWEHVWLRDWGIHGKPEYLDAWWKAIDWAQAETHTGRLSRDLAFQF